MHACRSTLEDPTDFIKDLCRATDQAGLHAMLAECARELGFAYFALSHHVDLRRSPHPAIRLHNYPLEWEQYYDENSLGVSDPVHRASHVTSVGFTWSDIPRLIPLTPGDRDILARGEGQGIGDGFTIPANVPGEASGSCSFANPKGVPLPTEQLALAQLLGAFSFEAARRLWRVRQTGEQRPCLTDRQRECIVWMARGKSDWEISRIIGVEHETVVRHLKQARERYGVGKRTMLAVQALFDGSISFTDIVRR